MLKVNAIVLLIIIFVFAFSCIACGAQKDSFCLKKSYELYKASFMTKDGRIIDYDKNNITTSEGQSYIMLRSLVMDDKPTFDLTYKWTTNNLQRKDYLFSWLWGENSKGEYKILDENTATDADVDIAYALILAYERWNQAQYLQDAQNIINSIWNNETRRIDSYLVLMPGVSQTKEEKIEINPSYFAPYEFRFFQKYDEMHNWNFLIDSSYYYLNQAMATTETHLPPNWFSIENGQIVLKDSERSDFSYDAIRVFIRIYMDYLRTGEKRAQPILEKSKFFAEKWRESKKFYTNYKANGELRDRVEFIGSIAILNPVIENFAPDVSKEIYKTKLAPIFNNPSYWEGKNGYYEKNLSWFGCYFYHKHSNEYRKMHKYEIK